MLEYPDPTEINDGAELSLLPTGDVRVDLVACVDAASIDRLRAAWQAAEHMRI